MSVEVYVTPEFGGESEKTTYDTGDDISVEQGMLTVWNEDSDAVAIYAAGRWERAVVVEDTDPE